MTTMYGLLGILLKIASPIRVASHGQILPVCPAFGYLTCSRLHQIPLLLFLLKRIASLLLLIQNILAKFLLTALSMLTAHCSLKADGRKRSKLGMPPFSARNLAGSYDADKKILTITFFDISPADKYLNMEWDTKKPPFSGDAVNAYNDGLP